jgi:trk system potassium uptake protein TrkA
VSLGGEKGIQEMTVPDRWEGKTLRELQLPLQHNVSVVAVRDVLKSEMRVPPDPDAPLLDTDTLLVAGSSQNLERLARMK